MNLNKRLNVIVSLLAFAVSGAASAPPYTNYSEYLQRDIQGEHHGFIAGNVMYYIAGISPAEWDSQIENETIGFTHPMVRDGRARGYGIIDDPKMGRGHDKWGWDFYRKNRIAFGTVLKDGKEFKHPVPDKMYWRPDQHIIEYTVGDTKIKENKFIAMNDVLTTIIESDKDIRMRFEGESFAIKAKLPGFDGDDPSVNWDIENNSTVNFNKDKNTVEIFEDAKVWVKAEWKVPVREGKSMYSGMTFLLSSSQGIDNMKAEKDPKFGNTQYSFEINIPANTPVVLTYAANDDANVAYTNTADVLKNANAALTAKTKYINDLLNFEIPYFRSSDEMANKVYYYLWALYFMYFRDTGEGWLKYPHTQTAINNFMGLHLWDSWAYTQAGSWVANKEQYAYGNILSWQFFVGMKNKANLLPDNFGTTWVSLGAYMGFTGAVEPAWEQYRRSGDKEYLKEVYTKLFKPLYWDNNGPTQTFGIETNALRVLQEMAKALGMNEDVKHWETFKKNSARAFEHNWSGKWDGFYGQKGTPWKDIWALVALQSDLMNKTRGNEMVDKYILDTDVGFISPVGINTRAADDPPNGIFRCSTISLWLGVDGMFRQEASYAGILTMLNHINAMTREWGYPVAPEAWESNHLSWGSRYYNWDIAFVNPMIERLGGIDYSIVEDTFTLKPNLPSTWDFIEMYVPVVKDGKTNWVHTKVERKKVGENYEIEASYKNSVFSKNKIILNKENRQLGKHNGDLESIEEYDLVAFKTTDAKNGKANITLSSQKVEKEKTLVWATPLARIFYKEVKVDVENILPGTELRFTIDGSEPTEVSPLFPKEGITITETTNFIIKAFANDGTNYKPYTLTYESPKLLEPTKVDTANLKTGLQYTAYKIPPKTKRIPDFAKLEEIGKGVIQADQLQQQIQLEKVKEEINRKEDFALHITGYITVPKDQVYNIYVASDDGSRLFINDELVIDLNSASDYDPWFKDGYVGLKAGTHKVDIYYYQAHYRTKLMYEIKSGDEKAKKPVPKDSWKYQP
ncbi:MAG: PA14 domain-containing protein [Lentisphaeria bacterium]|nr:PA14 domain-containing protein [Lentisphaeria bacterium]